MPTIAHGGSTADEARLIIEGTGPTFGGFTLSVRVKRSPRGIVPRPSSVVLGRFNSLPSHHEGTARSRTRIRIRPRGAVASRPKTPLDATYHACDERELRSAKRHGLDIVHPRVGHPAVPLCESVRTRRLRVDA